MPDKIDLIYDMVKELKAEQSKMRTENQNEHTKIRDKISTTNSDISALKVKAGVWGALAGVLPASIVAALAYLKSHTGG